MAGQIFVTGMLRSGTTLIQTLLTNHPALFVAYQPFHQLYVDGRRQFLEEHGLQRALPLGDGMDSDPEERSAFAAWLQTRRFVGGEGARLAANAAGGKGGGASELAGRLPAGEGTFFEIRERLHRFLAAQFGRQHAALIGAKEVLCEEYLPALVACGIPSLIIMRDPRAVIASANNGRYLGMVGDRYPLLMLIRLWRKSCAYWLEYRNHPLVCTIRYEDLVQRPDAVLQEVAGWLGIAPFAEGMLRRPLLDHAGKVWKGNSSFGDKTGVDGSSRERWRDLLTQDEVRFIEACTRRELAALGYRPCSLPERDAIRDFEEEVGNVRPSYLELYSLDRVRREQELRRWDEGAAGLF